MVVGLVEECRHDGVHLVRPFEDFRDPLSFVDQSRHLGYCGVESLDRLFPRYDFYLDVGNSILEVFEKLLEPRIPSRFSLAGRRTSRVGPVPAPPEQIDKI